MNKEKILKTLLLSFIAVIAISFFAATIFFKQFLLYLLSVFLFTALVLLVLEAYLRIQHNIDKKFENIVSNVEGKAGNIEYELSKNAYKTENLDKKIFEFFKKDAGINISGFINSETGLGNSACGIIKALEHGGIDFKINNIVADIRRENREYVNIFTDQHPFPVNLICVNADQARIAINSSLPGGKKYLKGKYNIGYWYWETPVLPEKYSSNSRFFQEIWAATDFVCNSIAVNVPIPVVKIPPAFTRLEIRERENVFRNIRPDISDKDFIFLTVFDADSCWQRKNPEAAVESFRKAFSDKDKVKLIIKTVNQNKSPFCEKLMDRINGNSNICLINQYFPPKLMDNLYDRANAYISLHRCEGLGITMIKSMLFAKPVIATAYGGNTDFMNVNNSYMVDFVGYNLKEDIDPYEKGTLWAEPDVEQAAFFMKNILNDYNKAVEVGGKGQKDVAVYFDPDRVAGLIKRRLQVIQKDI